MIAINNLSSGSKLAIEIAQKLARESNQPAFGAPHLLMALLNSRVGITSFLTLMDKDLAYLKGWAQYRIDEYQAKGLPSDEPTADDKVPRVLDVAKTFMLMFNQKAIEPLSILCALARPEVGFPKSHLSSLRLEEEELVQAILSDHTISKAIKGEQASSGTSESGADHSPANAKVFLQYCIDKIALANSGKIDPVYGRDSEIREMENILCRRTKPNVIIVGEPGVGKTALVDGFALKIAQGEVSEYFKSAQLYQLDIGALMAGASYRGEVEDRLKKILHEIKRRDKVLLFIDEIHMILDSGTGASGIANLLKPELARGEINVIGATTNKEYRLHIEKDPAFSRRFEILNVEEPSIAKAIKMIGGVKNLFEEHHQFGIDDEAVIETVKLAKRYFPQRFLPDSAIDLMDRTMASFRILEDNLAIRIERVRSELAVVDPNASGEHWIQFWEEAVNILSPLALDGREKELPTNGDGVTWLAYIEDVLQQLTVRTTVKKEAVDKGDISRIVAIATGIPTGKIEGDEQQKLMDLERHLKSKVIGQDYAADTIAKAIRRSRSGIKEKGKPIGNFFFVGPTGTGKTELAKTLTELLFNDSANLIRFDMSEFMESHSVSLLKGSPPGYVGYGEGGMLVNEIRSKPYSVVLFDEVEKAHPDVFKLLLQVLDEGHLHDTLGKKGTFTDAVILFTSNAESEWVVHQFEKGEIPKEAEIRDRMVAHNHFRPEFLNRLDAIIPFSPLSKDDLLKILELQLKRFSGQLSEKKISVELSLTAKEFLADLGYSPAFGARPLKRVMDSYLADEISEMLISGRVKEGQQINVDIVDEKLTFEVT